MFIDKELENEFKKHGVKKVKQAIELVKNVGRLQMSNRSNDVIYFCTDKQLKLSDGISQVTNLENVARLEMCGVKLGIKDINSKDLGIIAGIFTAMGLRVIIKTPKI